LGHLAVRQKHELLEKESEANLKRISVIWRIW
jgi:hypothetical protein